MRPSLDTEPFVFFALCTLAWRQAPLKIRLVLKQHIGLDRSSDNHLIKLLSLTDSATQWRISLMSLSRTEPQIVHVMVSISELPCQPSRMSRLSSAEIIKLQTLAIHSWLWQWKAALSAWMKSFMRELTSWTTLLWPQTKWNAVAPKDWNTITAHYSLHARATL